MDSRTLDRVGALSQRAPFGRPPTCVSRTASRARTTGVFLVQAPELRVETQLRE
jgi:hypothetical protein